MKMIILIRIMMIQMIVLIAQDDGSEFEPHGSRLTAGRGPGSGRGPGGAWGSGSARDIRPWRDGLIITKGKIRPNDFVSEHYDVKQRTWNKIRRPPLRGGHHAAKIRA